MLMNGISKKCIIVVATILSLFAFSCGNRIELENSETSASFEYDDAKYYNIFGIKPAKVIIPKNQTNSQSLSVVICDNNENLIVFDGGRVEDADYLCDVIKENGGRVKYWFITHIHDDHIGALYNILEKKRTDISIENIYYDFATFDWYYKMMGDDAGIYILFENVISEYNNYLKQNSFNQTNILKYEDGVYNELQLGDLSVSIINKHLELTHDPINNTSIVYNVNLKGTKILILGDLGLRGGEIVFNDEYSFKDTDIVVLSHHGQNGIDPNVYKNFNPRVIIWPTSKDIFKNKNNRYYTDDTKVALREIESIEYEIKSYEETAIIS